MKKVIDIKNLSVSYGGKVVLRNINLSMDPGKLVGIIGPNGAGKSTLIKAILDLIPKDQGEIKVYGRSFNQARKRVAYVPQYSKIDWDFPILVKDTVLLGTYPKLGLFKRPSDREKNWALECLKKVGMEDFADRQIGELSGGQQQRVFVARALAQNANCFFLDEPFIGIDVSSEEVIINLLKELRDIGKSIFIVHHDLSKVESYFDNIILLNKDLIGAGPVSEIFKPEYMHRAYQTPLFMFRNTEVKK